MARKRAKRAVFIAALLLIVPVPALTAGLDFASRTYMASRETGYDDHHLTFYEYVDAGFTDIGTNGLSLRFGGWGRGETGGELYGKDTKGDVQYAYLEYAPQKTDVAARLGRIYVTEGVAANEQMDGLYTRAGLRYGFDAAAYAGRPTETARDHRNGDLVYGFRVSQGRDKLYRAGFSYLKEKNDGERFREEEGLDLYVQPLPNLDLAGCSTYNGETDGWSRHDYTLTWRPRDLLVISLAAGRVDYANFFQAADASPFTEPFLDTEESMGRLGGAVAYTIANGPTLRGAYTHFDYENKGNARDWGLGLTYPLADGAIGLSLDRMDGEEKEFRYFSFRGYLYKNLGKWNLTLDLLDISYDQAIYGVKDSYALALAGGYKLSDTVKVGADLEYGHNPFYEEELKAFVKLLYEFAMDYSTEGGQKK